MAQRKPKNQKGRKARRSTATPRAKISQADFPRFPLEKVLRIPLGLWNEFAGKSAAPHDVALALDLAPTSGNWRLLCGASLAYGLTEGGYNATRIELSEIGRRIVAPFTEGDDARATVEAILHPRIMREFLSKYDRAKFPSDTIAANVLFDLGLPKDRGTKAVETLKANGAYAGILRETKTGLFVALDSMTAPTRGLTDHTEAPPAEPDGVAATLEPSGSDPIPSGAGTTATGSITPPPLPTQPLARGRVIDVYKLRQRLGSGFSAEVWSASVQKAPPGVDLKKGDSVAIKFYHAHAMALPDQVLRVEREYRIAQTLRHPHLIRIFEFLLASPRPHHNFLVMDVARGQPLNKFAGESALSPTQALAVYQQVLGALDALHGAGALHRDVKPGNICVELRNGQVHATLLDLGIVSITYQQGVTAVSHFLGSKHWAPIEQLMGDPLDERSDLYGAAAVAYSLLSGTEPYPGRATEAAVAVEMGRSPLVLEPSSEVPADIADMINASLSYQRSNRPSSARDCLDVLRRSTPGV